MQYLLIWFLFLYTCNDVSRWKAHDIARTEAKSVVRSELLYVPTKQDLQQKTDKWYVDHEIRMLESKINSRCECR